MAEFVKVAEEYVRYCEQYETCAECEFIAKMQRRGAVRGIAATFEPEMCRTCVIYYPGEAEEVILEWAEKHPRKTMLETFIDSKPGTVQLPNGTFRICPNHVNPEWTNLCTDGKGNCRECWGREV